MSGDNDALIKLDRISKSFADRCVLRELTLNVYAGTALLLLGANGSGKSTLLRICMDLYRADSGSVIFAPQVSKKFQRHAGYLGHDLMLYGHLTVRENLNLMRRLRGLQSSLDECLQEWKLGDYAAKKLNELSKGLQFRAALAAALIHNPAFVFLDEPSSSLDQSTLEFLLAKIKNLSLSQQGFCVIATHDIHRLAPSANRVVVLHEGKIASDSGESVGSQNSLQASIDFYMKSNR